MTHYGTALWKQKNGECTGILTLISSSSLFKYLQGVTHLGLCAQPELNSKPLVTL